MNAGKKWVKEDEELLKEYYNNGEDIQEISKKLERHELSIAYKVCNLELEKNICDARGYNDDIKIYKNPIKKKYKKEKKIRPEIKPEIAKLRLEKRKNIRKCMVEKEKELGLEGDKKTKYSCLMDECLNYGTKEFENYCIECYENKFNKMNIRRKKIKEIEVINMVLKRYPDFDWKINEKITKIQRIPDMYLIINELMLIIEIDEKQHKWYSKKKENKRDNELLNLEDNVIIIKFNPDEYKKGEEFIKSCWYGKKLKKGKVEEWYERIKKLNETIENVLLLKGKRTIKLFYDEKEVLEKEVLEKEVLEKEVLEKEL